jgi:hypothetical protein
MRSPFELFNQARDEAYVYFDKKVRRLHKTPDGKIDPTANGLADNDVDAFRHAYVSGVFTQEYGELAARTLGLLYEFGPEGLYANQQVPGERNMDLWNNAVGRKYGAKTKIRKSLLKLIHGAMKRGELIFNPTDEREYRGATSTGVSKLKPVIVLQENKKGRNVSFYDTEKKVVMSADEFVARIAQGQYPGYTMRDVRGRPTPASRSDDRRTNNLG